MEQKITLQRIFDLARNHFIVGDGQPSWIKGMQCQYKSPDGRMCAVGLALPEGHKAQEYQGPASMLLYHYPELFDIQKWRLLNELQSELHDNLQIDGCWLYTKEKMKNHYLNVAEKFNLIVPT